MRNDAERLADIIEAAEKIDVRAGRGREFFDADEDVRIVLTHLVQVIGEAASRITDDVVKANPHVPWRQIVGMRNRVVHDYFEIDPDVLWAAVTGDVPLLAGQIRGILAALPDDRT